MHHPKHVCGKAKSVCGEEKSVSIDPEPLALTCKLRQKHKKPYQTLRRLYVGKRREEALNPLPSHAKLRQKHKKPLEDCLRGREEKTVCGEKKIKPYAGKRREDCMRG
jgi:hypothetical protein